MEQCEAIGTPEQAAKLKSVIESSRETPGCLMHILQEAQEIYGFLPINVQKQIAEGLNISLSEVYGVVTFYSQFSLNPKGKHRVSVCLGTACYVKGSGGVIEKFGRILGVEPGHTTPDGRFTLEATRCIGCCGLAPVLTVNGEVYGKVTEDSVDEILAKYNNA